MRALLGGLDPAVAQATVDRVNAASRAENAAFRHQEQIMTELLEEFYLYLFLLALALVAIILWHRFHPRSHRIFEFAALCLFPPAFCVLESPLRFWKFLLVWVAFTGATLYVAAKAFKRPIDPGTPRKVYTWFMAGQRASFGVGVVGVALLSAHFLIAIVTPVMGIRYVGLTFSAVAVLVMHYGVYFGVINRDAAEFCAERMSSAAALGGVKHSDAREQSASRAKSGTHCCVCQQTLSNPEAALPGEATLALTGCAHRAHDYCARGWCLAGKKSACPVCGEGIDVRKLLTSNPWMKAAFWWARLLNLCRVLTVWNPVVFMFSGTIFKFLDRQLGFNHVV